MCDSTAHGDSVMSETRDILHRARTQREGDCDTRERISPPEDWPSTADLYYPVWHADVPSAPWLHREWGTTHTENELCEAVQEVSGMPGVVEVPMPRRDTIIMIKDCLCISRIVE